jgi:membrane protein
VSKINSWFRRVNQFFSKDLWTIDLSKKGFFQRTVYQSAKVGILSYKHFQDDKLQLRASALTFFTLLSVVPVLAMAFGIAKGFGLDKELENQILENFSGQEEVLTTSLEFARNLLENTKGGLIAGIGLAFLFYTVMQLLGNIEKSFNDIWYITKHRTITRKITDYMSIILLGPVLLVVANSLTITVTREIAKLTESVELIGLFKGVIFPLLRILPYTVVWLLFTLIYMIMPNTNVKLKSGLIAGIIAGTIFQLVQWALIYFGVGVARNNAIYGSFAALPLFLIWLQLSWLIVLVGAEISYAIQNVSKHNVSDEGEEYSIDSKKRLALAISFLVIRNFKEGKPPLTFIEINNYFGASDRLLHEVVSMLLNGQILLEAKTDDNMQCYQPAQDTDRLDVAKILESYENEGLALQTEESKEILAIADGIIDKLNMGIEKSKENKLLKEILDLSKANSPGT